MKNGESSASDKHAGVKRVRIQGGAGFGDWEAVEHPDGQYVSYTDYRKLERELAELRDHPIARMQVGPDGVVPTGTVQALELWKAEADRLHAELAGEKRLNVGLIEGVAKHKAEIERLERELAEAVARHGRWMKLADERAIEVADLKVQLARPSAERSGVEKRDVDLFVSSLRAQKTPWANGCADLLEKLWASPSSASTPDRETLAGKLVALADFMQDVTGKVPDPNLNCPYIMRAAARALSSHERSSDVETACDLLALAETWCEASARVEAAIGATAQAELWRNRAKMLRSGYKPLTVAAASATRTSAPGGCHVCSGEPRECKGTVPNCPYDKAKIHRDDGGAKR